MAGDSTLPHFRALSPAHCLSKIAEMAGLTAQERQLLASHSALPLDTANGMIDNVIGKFELPAIVSGFCLNGKEMLLPILAAGSDIDWVIQEMVKAKDVRVDCAISLLQANP